MNLLQRIKDGANRVSEKAQNSVEIGKLNSQISDIEHDMEIEFTKMGRLFYEGYRSRDLSLAEGMMTEHSRACLRLQDKIDELRARIAELKNEKLCKCGAVVALGANFCPNCGRKLEQLGGAVPAVYQEKPKPAPQSERPVQYEEPEAEEDYESGAREPYSYIQAADDEDEHLPPPLDDYEGGEEPGELDRRMADELERERERQLELDRRIRDWQARGGHEHGETEGTREMVKCQICRADLPKGSMWCPRCGSEQI
ncbi:hypothetical protein PSTEL_02850 [Paenibacillus stellifer]|uniref:Zinc ribbon domain-containing protein n=1 Tax=Paenibacillus stellifer TaxID=169760 RepID=A0A089LQ29_9BACL|nr:zinc ribbon domain-containing protein [Paenibacillus stellifer]AIQ62210.1 hypothetical protein PSTEL_02850 [Paenibacillus stellifer]